MSSGAKYGEALQFIREAIKDPGEDCIEWPYYRDRRGYGRVSFEGGTPTASRVALILYTGESPSPGIEVAHSVECHNPACINPRHLRFATRKENNDDRFQNETILRGEEASWAKLTNDEVISIRLDPRSVTAIAEDHVVSRSTVSLIKRREVWGHLPGEVIPSAGHLSGESHPSTKLTEEDIVAIRSDTRLQVVIAEEYGISQTQVSRIKRREKWAHVE